MPGWAELHSYSLSVALACGTLTALSFWGVGHLLCRGSLMGFDPCVRGPAEAVAGTLAMSLVVQLLAMANATGVNIMRAVWLAGLIAAAASLVLSLPRARGAIAAAAPGGGLRLLAWAPALILAMALLLGGSAPETRADELSYHTLASARLLTDGGLRFHPLPWEAGILPQLAWHFALSPLYSVTGGAGAGVVSAWLALLLAFSTARLTAWQSGSAALGATAAFLALAGGYAFVFFATTGPHAFGYLSVFAAVAAVGWSAELRRTASPGAYALAVALGCTGAVAGKVTLLPLAALITGMAAWDVLAGGRAAGSRSKPVLRLVLVPAVALTPLIAWSWVSTGTPLGVLTAALAPAGALDAETLGAYQGTRELFANSFQWRFEAAYWNLPMIVCALAALALETQRTRRLRWWLIAGLQTLVILLLLPKELRHLGGIQYPLMAAGLVAIAQRWHGRIGAARLALLAQLAAVPWALLVLWIASIYLPLAAGRESAATFVRRYGGLQADFEALDQRLPPDARILIGRSRSDPMQYGWYARPPVWYAPRPVLFDTAEVGGSDPVYLLYVGGGVQGTRGAIPLDPWLPAGYLLGRSVYADPAARFYPSRTPRGGPGLARLEVFELRRAP